MFGRNKKILESSKTQNIDEIIRNDEAIKNELNFTRKVWLTLNNAQHPRCCHQIARMLGMDLTKPAEMNKISCAMHELMRKKIIGINTKGNCPFSRIRHGFYEIVTAENKKTLMYSKRAFSHKLIRHKILSGLLTNENNKDKCNEKNTSFKDSMGDTAINEKIIDFVEKILIANYAARLKSEKDFFEDELNKFNEKRFEKFGHPENKK